MGTSFTEVMDVKNFLRQQYILVSEEWTEACIDFIKQEQGNRVIPSQTLKKSVHEQWLQADLEEIACPSLPQELPTAQKIILRESFALQVQGIRDISRPAYAQLKQLTNYSNANEDFSTDPKAAIPEWEAKPTRMLMLNLTDGFTQVQGMEYRAIHFLSPNLPPGIKVLIKGPVECRYGVFLLTSENISILGGEVESKLEQYSRENILKQQLQIEDDDDSQVTSATNSSITAATNSSITAATNSSRTASTNSSRTAATNSSRTAATNSSRTASTNSSRTAATNSSNINPESSRFDAPSTRNSYPNVVSRNQPLSNSGRSHSFPPNNTRNEDLLEHFDDDDDFEQNLDLGMLDEIENSQRQTSETVVSQEDDFEGCDMWQEDEDVLRDVMEFQDANPEFKMPFEVNEANSSSTRSGSSYSDNGVFTYLSTVVNDPLPNTTITIKGFIITVLSKLECTPSKGYSLFVKINDGTATINANIHDKVLQEIIGVSAQDLMKKQQEASKNPEIRKEVMQTLSKCKLTLQNYNCLMDVKFTPGEKPCIVKCSQVNRLHIQQLLERVRSRF